MRESGWYWVKWNENSDWSIADYMKKKKWEMWTPFLGHSKFDDTLTPFKIGPKINEPEELG